MVYRVRLLDTSIQEIEIITPAQKRKRGKQSKFATYNGEVINGLCYWVTRGLYYCYYDEGGKRKKHYFPSKYSNEKVTQGLLWEFRKFQQQRGNKDISIEKPDYNKGLKGKGSITFTDNFHKLLEQHNVLYEQIIEGIEVKEVDIPEDLIWEKCRNLIINNIDEAKRKLGLDIKLLSTIEPKSLTLVRLIELYNNRTREEGLINEKQKKEVKTLYHQFCEIIKVKTISEIKDIHIEGYKKRIIAIYNKGYEKGGKKKEYSVRYINNRYSAIKGIFSWARKNLTDTNYRTECSTAYDMLLRLNNLKEKPTKPNMLSKDDFLEMIDTDNKMYKAITLLAQNGAMRQTEIINIQFKDIDLEKRKFSKIRQKTKDTDNVIRSCCLWEKTVIAIKDYLGKRKYKNDDYLFVNGEGRKLTIKIIWVWWNKQRQIKNVKNNFKDMRPTFYTIALDNNFNKKFIDIVMGHSNKNLENSYYARSPEKVKKVCQFMENYYFG